MANLEKMIMGAGIMLGTAGLYWLYSQGYTPENLDNIFDIGCSAVNYLPKTNFTPLWVLNLVGLGGLGVGGYKTIKGALEN